jgi:Protein of unknown function (DUF3631)/BT4734-like, N-terminal domain
MKISMVQRCTETKTTDIEVHSAITAIRCGRWKKDVEPVRQALARGDNAFAEKTKKNLAALMFCGRFKQRASNALIKYSGLICADIDGLDDQLPGIRERLQRLPQVVAVFVSPSGNGLKVLVRVAADPVKHSPNFFAVEKLIKDATGIQIDESGKDIARLCFVSYDPDLYYNEHAIELAPLPEPEKPTQPPSNNGEFPADLPLRERIATEIFGPLTCSAEKNGFFCRCPGEAAHTTMSGLKHAMVYLDRVPTFDCKHSSCKEISKAFNARLRSEVGKAEREARQKAEKIVQFTTVGHSVNADTPAEKETDEETLQRLAALPPLEYDRVRVSEAQRLGCRPATLDKYVESRRLTLNTGMQGRALQLADVELWPEHVNGADVLNEISTNITDYVVLEKSSADVCAVWAGHAHAFRIFTCSPRLHVTSPDKGCGKTTLRDVIALQTPRATLAENLSVAVLFRVIEKYQPTLFADECDTWMRDNDELRGMLNAGHRRDGKALRCEGESNEVRAFNVFAPVVLCGIGSLPGTLHDRSISVRLERAKPGEIRKRFDSNHVEPEKELCRKLARFCADNMAKIEACDPKLPDGVFNRLADNWRPLFAIAEVAGDDWPQRVATALFELTHDNDVAAQGIGTMLLADIREIFANACSDRLHSETIATHLAAIEGRPWAEWKAGKPISKNQLAKQLKHFNIEPSTVRIGEEVLKGYLQEQFKEAFDRYLPADPPFQNVTALQKDDFTYENPTE